MTAEELRAGLARLAERVGPFESDNIHLAHGVFTMGPEVRGIELRGTNVLQLVTDIVGEDLAGVRVLDLGAAEGLFSVELARRGAEVVAIEARHQHTERLRFVKDVLALDRLEVIEGDVRELSVERHGHFDLVLCLGILYHLPAPDVFEFVRAMREVCGRAAIVDTHVSVHRRTTVVHQGRTYAGLRYREHDPGSSLQERAAEARASIDNPESFWPTHPSLVNMLVDGGFTSVLEARSPRRPALSDRVVLVAMAGTPVRLESAPQLPAWTPTRWPEKEVVHVVDVQRHPLARRARQAVPRPVARAVRRLRARG